MHAYDLLKLIGVVIIVVGIALKLRTTLVVVVAALATGLIAGLPLFSHEGFFQQLRPRDALWSQADHANAVRGELHRELARECLLGGHRRTEAARRWKPRS